MPIVFLPVPSTFSRLWCPQDHQLLVWIRRWITSTFATSAGGTSVRVPLSRSTCAPTRATSPSSAMCARRLSPPRGISRYSQEFPSVPPAFYSTEFLLVPFFGFLYFLGPYGYSHVDESDFAAGSSNVLGATHATWSKLRPRSSWIQCRAGVHAETTRALFPYLPPFFNGLPPKVIIRCTFLLLYMLTAKNYLAWLYY